MMMEFTYELHLHSCLSPCGDDLMTPNNIAGMAMLNGVKIAALTDHNTSRNCPAFFEACAKVGYSRGRYGADNGGGHSYGLPVCNAGGGDGF